MYVRGVGADANDGREVIVATEVSLVCCVHYCACSRIREWLTCLAWLLMLTAAGLPHVSITEAAVGRLSYTGNGRR